MEAKASGVRFAGGVNHSGIVMMLGGIKAYVVQDGGFQVPVAVGDPLPFK